MNTYFDRYGKFKQNGIIKFLPFIKILPKSTDKRYIWKKGSSRMDIISNQYYQSPYYGWIIKLANPQFGIHPFEIPNGVELRIPYPLRESKQQYIQEVEKWERLYADSDIKGDGHDFI